MATARQCITIASTQRAKVWADRRECLRQLLDVLEILRTVSLPTLPQLAHKPAGLNAEYSGAMLCCDCGAKQVALDPQAAAPGVAPLGVADAAAQLALGNQILELRGGSQRSSSIRSSPGRWPSWYRP